MQGFLEKNDLYLIQSTELQNLVFGNTRSCAYQHALNDNCPGVSYLKTQIHDEPDKTCI